MAHQGQYTQQQLQALQALAQQQQGGATGAQQQAMLQQYYRQMQGGQVAGQQQQQQQQQQYAQQYQQRPQATAAGSAAQQTPAAAAATAAQYYQYYQRQQAAVGVKPAATTPQQQQYQQYQRQQQGGGYAYGQSSDRDEAAKLQSKIVEVEAAIRAEEAHIQSNMQYAQNATQQQQNQERVRSEMDAKEKEMEADIEAIRRAKVELEKISAGMDAEKARVEVAQKRLTAIQQHADDVVKRGCGGRKPVGGDEVVFSRTKKVVSAHEARQMWRTVPSALRCLTRTWLTAADRKAEVAFAPKGAITENTQSADAVVGEAPAAGTGDVTVRVVLVECSAFDDHPHVAQSVVGRNHQGSFDLYHGTYDPTTDGDDADSHETHCNIARRVLKEQAGVELDAGTEYGVLATTSEEGGKTSVYLMPGVTGTVVLKALEKEVEVAATPKKTPQSGPAQSPKKTPTKAATPGKEENGAAEEDVKMEADEAPKKTQRQRVFTPVRHTLGHLAESDNARQQYATLAAKILTEVGRYKLALALQKVLQRLPAPAAEVPEGEDAGTKRKHDGADDDEPAAKKPAGAAPPAPQLHDLHTTTTVMEETVDCAGMRPFLVLDKPDAKGARAGVVGAQDVLDLLLSVADDMTYGEVRNLMARINLDNDSKLFSAYRQFFTKQTKTTETVSSQAVPNRVRVL